MYFVYVLYAGRSWRRQEPGSTLEMSWILICSEWLVLSRCLVFEYGGMHLFFICRGFPDDAQVAEILIHKTISQQPSHEPSPSLCLTGLWGRSLGG